MNIKDIINDLNEKYAVGDAYFTYEYNDKERILFGGITIWTDSIWCDDLYLYVEREYKKLICTLFESIIKDSDFKELVTTLYKFKHQ